MFRFRNPMRSAAAAALVGFVSVAAPDTARPANDAPAAAPEIYKWVDEHGIAHYTTDKKRIPRSLRKRLRSLPNVAAAPSPPEAAPDLIGPLPDQPGHPEGWVSRNAAPWPTEKQKEELEAAELAAQIVQVQEEIEGLEGEIADREEQILALLATAQGDTLRDDPAFRALAEELPDLQADLEALRERRGELTTPP